MPYLPTPDLTLNDDTRPLIKDNNRAIAHLERALSILHYEDIDIVRSNVAQQSNELLIKHSLLDVDAKVIYVQALIDALASKTAFLLKHATIINSLFSDAVRDYQEPIATKINMIGGRMADSAVANFIISQPDFYEKTRAEIVKVFMNAKDTTKPINMMPINHLLEMVTKIDRYSKSEEGMSPDEAAAHYEHITKIALGIEPIDAPHPKTLPLDYLAFITDIDSANEITTDLNATNNGYDRATTAWLATILGMIIETVYPYLTPAVRVTGGFANIIIHDVSGKALVDDVSYRGEITFVSTESNDTCYYNVYWQGFDPIKQAGFATAPVRCDGMFSLNDLQVLLAKLYGFDRALVISWQTIPNKAAYEQFNA